MATIITQQIRDSVRKILKGADLTSLSSKKVRRMLEAEYDADFTDRKQEIDDVLMKAISEEEDSQNSQASNGKSPPTEKANGSSEEESDIELEIEDEPPKKKVKKSNKTENKKSKPNIMSSPITDDIEDEDEPPKKKVKKSNKTETKKVDDEELAKQLQEEETGGRRSRHRSVKKPPPKRKPIKEKGEKGPRSGKSSYSQPCALSPDLAIIMGTDRMARSDVVKRMWEIVRERKLADPKNKQFMLCDEELLKVFGKKRLRTFGMMKFLKSHIKDMKDIVDQPV